MEYKEIISDIYSLTTGQDLTVENGFVLKTKQNGIVLIDLPTNIDIETWIETLKKSIDLSKIKYIIIQSYNHNYTLTLKKLKISGVNATVVCSIKSAIYHLYPLNSDFEWQFISDKDVTFPLSDSITLKVGTNPFILGNLNLITTIPQKGVLFSNQLFSSLTNNKEFEYTQYEWMDILDFQRSFIPTFNWFMPENSNFLKDIEHIIPGRGPIINYNGYEFLKELQKYDEKHKINDANMNSRKHILKKLENYISPELLNSLSNQSHDEFMTTISKKGNEYLFVLFQPLNINVFENKLNKVLQLENPDIVNLKHKLGESTIDQITSPVTELFNKKFLEKLMSEELEKRMTEKVNGCFLYMQFNENEHLNNLYDSDTINRILVNFSVELEDFMEESQDRQKHQVFHLDGDIFCYYIPEGQIEYFLFIAEKLQIMINRSTIFTEKISISIGIVTFKELYSLETLPVNPFEYLHDRAMFRLKFALNKDLNHINFEVLQEDYSTRVFNLPIIIIISSDNTFREVLKFHLSTNGFEVKDFSDSLIAYDFIENNTVDLIISDHYLPKLDGLSLKEKLNLKLRLRRIPFILNVSIKSDNVITRAHALNILHIFKHPISLNEISGLSNKLVEGSAGENND